MSVLEVKNLSKSFKSKKVLDDLNLHVEENEIVGFIGPNGAGKSTTMKCIATLIYPDKGEIVVCDHNIAEERNQALKSMAAQIETPGLYLDMTGEDNLKLFAGLKGVGKDRIEAVKNFMNIDNDLKRKVSNYSMGMKQRLALGIALLGRPRFIMLDEPTNGLDPDGVIDLRNTIFKLKEEGISFLISSHQLGEIEKISDRVVAINHGKITDVTEYIKQSSNYVLVVDNSSDAFDILSKLEYIEDLSIDNDKIRFNFKQERNLDDVLDTLRNHEISILDLFKTRKDIEELYQDIYGDHHEESY